VGETEGEIERLYRKRGREREAMEQRIRNTERETFIFFCVW
jgi:hypothetical protein